LVVYGYTLVVAVCYSCCWLVGWLGYVCFWILPHTRCYFLPYIYTPHGSSLLLVVGCRLLRLRLFHTVTTHVCTFFILHVALHVYRLLLVVGLRLLFTRLLRCYSYGYPVGSLRLLVVTVDSWLLPVFFALPRTFTAQFPVLDWLRVDCWLFYYWFPVTFTVGSVGRSHTRFTFYVCLFGYFVVVGLVGLYVYVVVLALYSWLFYIHCWFAVTFNGWLLKLPSHSCLAHGYTVVATFTFTVGYGCYIWLVGLQLHVYFGLRCCWLRLVVYIWFVVGCWLLRCWICTHTFGLVVWFVTLRLVGCWLLYLRFILQRCCCYTFTFGCLFGWLVV